jgi:hypothetical protein
LAARFLPILRRVRLCCGFWLPPPSQKPQRPNQYVYKNGCPLLPLQHTEIHHGRGKQSLLRTMLEKRGQKGKFWCGQNLPFCFKRTHKKIKRCQGAEILQTKPILPQIMNKRNQKRNRKNKRELGRHIYGTFPTMRNL